MSTCAGIRRFVSDRGWYYKTLQHDERAGGGDEMRVMKVRVGSIGTWNDGNQSSSKQSSATVLDLLGHVVDNHGSIGSKPWSQQDANVSDVDSNVEEVQHPENDSSSNHKT